MDNLISVKDFTPEELRKWQLKLLEILVYFRDFCEEHNLRFMLAAGTMLGAVRHKGFIPWDDDLDVTMPREDYDKLVDLWDQYADKSKFRCERTDKNRSVRFPMTVCRSMDTTCIYNHSVDDDICQGLKIDVEFLDGVPANKLKLLYCSFCAKLYALLSAERIPYRFPFTTRTLAKIILFVLPNHRMRWPLTKFLESQMKKYKFENSEYVRYLTNPFRKKSYFESVVYADFEGYKMPIPKGYHEILSAYYGDYMQYPPEDKRTPATDNIVFYDLDHSYLDYKGKYYCVKQK